MHNPRFIVALLLAALVGCSQSSSRLPPPEIEPEIAAKEAVKLYDTSGDGALDKTELAKCPGILSKLTAYDRDSNGSVAEAEIAQRLAELLKHGTGGTQLSCTILRQGRPLAGAEVVFEPEPYLGDEIQPARGTTGGSGIAEIGVPAEHLPERLRKFNIIHYGTFKVRITHPTISLPAKYNAETELGYETEAGNPYVQFNFAD